MKTLMFGTVIAAIGFAYGKIHGTSHPWRRYGRIHNYRPPSYTRDDGRLL